MTGASSPQREGKISATHVSELDRLGPDYWWLAVRRAHVEDALRRAPRPLRLLDFGCGTGTLTAGFIERFAPAEALGVDGTREALRAAEARGVPVRYVDMADPLALPFAPNAVTSLDVLEHLDDPVATLASLAAVCAPGALLVVTVPAMPSLTSRWDEVSGHRRRYTRGLLRAHLRAGGWTPQRTRYLFAWAVPPVWVQRSLLRRVQEFEFPDVSPLTNRLLTAAGRLERALGSPFPFGTSLVAVARRAEARGREG